MGKSIPSPPLGYVVPSAAPQVTPAAAAAPAATPIPVAAERTAPGSKKDIPARPSEGGGEKKETSAPAINPVLAPTLTPEKNKEKTNQPAAHGKDKSQHGHFPTFLETRTAVIEMQKAMQNFANTVSGYQPVDPKKPLSEAKPEVNKDFNDFITSSYAEQSTFKGKEAKDDPTALTIEQKQFSPLIEMRKVMTTIKTIGSRTGQLKPDGKWQGLTLNALQDIAALGDSFLGLAKDFGSVFTSTFTKKEVDAMRYNSKVVPDPKYIKAYAEANTRLINKLTQFYNQVKMYILDHPAYKRQISGEIPLYSAEKAEEDAGKIPAHLQKFTKDLSKLVLRKISISKPDGQQYQIDVPLSVLKDSRSFGDFVVNTLGFSTESLKDTKLMSHLLNEIMESVKSELNVTRGV